MINKVNSDVGFSSASYTKTVRNLMELKCGAYPQLRKAASDSFQQIDDASTKLGKKVQLKENFNEDGTFIDALDGKGKVLGSYQVYQPGSTNGLPNDIIRSLRYFADDVIEKLKLN